MGALLGYARISTGEQELALQHDALRAAGCARIFSDTASGALDERPKLSEALDHLRAGDTLVVWRLDRDIRDFQTTGSSHSRAVARSIPSSPADLRSPVSASRSRCVEAMNELVEIL